MIMKPFSLEEYLKNPERKVVTRDGKNVRIICTDFDNPNYPVIGEINGNKWPCSFTTNGLLIKDEVEQPSDLFFAPEKHEGWLNIYRGESGFYLRGNPYKSKEKAEKVAKANCRTFIATVKIEWEE